MAAYTIQEHSDWLKQMGRARGKSDLSPDDLETVCRHCGALKLADEVRCLHCGLDQFRPGERMQQQLASMWRMSREHDLHEEATSQDKPELDSKSAPGGDSDLPSDLTSDSVVENFEVAKRGRSSPLETPIDANTNLAEAEATAVDTLTTHKPMSNMPTTETIATDASNRIQPVPLRKRLSDVRGALRGYRANVYLAAAVVLALAALMWPTTSSARRDALSPMERMLIALGIAEAPAPVVHSEGNPSIDVWVDPHTALYYCPGEELYGKTADGRIASQHDAQVDRFQPAGRAVCE